MHSQYAFRRDLAAALGLAVQDAKGYVAQADVVAASASVTAALPLPSRVILPPHKIGKALDQVYIKEFLAILGRRSRRDVRREPFGRKLLGGLLGTVRDGVGPRGRTGFVLAGLALRSAALVTVVRRWLADPVVSRE